MDIPLAAFGGRFELNLALANIALTKLAACLRRTSSVNVVVDVVGMRSFYRAARRSSERVARTLLSSRSHEEKLKGGRA